MRPDQTRIARPLYFVEHKQAIPPLRARHLALSECEKATAVRLVRLWHSRLPNVQNGPWQFAFSAEAHGIIYAVALWHNPSTRCLPSHWLELRRLACAPDAPRNTCSRFMGWMVRWFAKNHPERERCISYQDTAVHNGTIYRAAGWTEAFVGTERQRDRTGKRAGTNRSYRTSINGTDPDKSAKVRWEKLLRAE